LEAEEIQLQAEEELVARMEAQLSALKEKLAFHNLTPIEEIARSLTEQLSSLRNIVVDTMEQSRNLNVIDSPDTAWPFDPIIDLERELSQCQNIASLEDLSSLKLLL
jgi:hypothetical protein